jgi:hypothetical protein
MSDAAEKDPELLFDEHTLLIEGERIVVREYRYLEGLRAGAIARPILAGMRELVQSMDDPDELEPEAIDALIGDHYTVWLELIALCIGRPVEWLAGLPDSAGQRISMAFWGANAGFFTRRLVVSGAVAQGLASRSRSPKSSPSLSPEGTEQTTTASPRDTAGGKSDATTKSRSSGAGSAAQT